MEGERERKERDGWMREVVGYWEPQARHSERGWSQKR
jgi:ribosomal protein S16